MSYKITMFLYQEMLFSCTSVNPINYPPFENFSTPQSSTSTTNVSLYFDYSPLSTSSNSPTTSPFSSTHSYPLVPSSPISLTLLNQFTGHDNPTSPLYIGSPNDKNFQPTSNDNSFSAHNSSTVNSPLSISPSTNLASSNSTQYTLSHKSHVPLRQSTCVSHPPSYLVHYHCYVASHDNFVLHTNDYSQAYPLSYVISYDKCSPSYKHFCCSISSNI